MKLRHIADLRCVRNFCLQRPKARLSVVFGNGDPVSAPKLIKEFITAAEKDKKTSPLTIKAGIMDGAVQSVEEVKALADILPREQLIAKIMGCLNSQATALAYVIQAIADKKAEVGEQ